MIGLLEPSQHQLAADRAHLVDPRAERLVGRDQLVTHVALAVGRAQVGVVELPRQREVHVGGADQAHADGGFAEAQPMLALELQHAVDVGR